MEDGRAAERDATTRGNHLPPLPLMPGTSPVAPVRHRRKDSPAAPAGGAGQPETLRSHTALRHAFRTLLRPPARGTHLCETEQSQPAPWFLRSS